LKYTQNYNLRKPEDTDPADIQDLNYNADAIDDKLKEIEDWEAAHLQATNPHSITPALIGAETPTGAQQKANQAETNAKDYADDVLETAIGAIEGDVGQLQTDMSTMQAGVSTHLTASMPHQVQNLQTGKTYRYGLRVTAEGQPQIIYEEVV
jgi:hypothetical protein